MASSGAVKVAHLVPALFGRNGVVGGAERYTLELARYMAERVPTQLVSFGERSHTERLGALEIVVIGGPHLVRRQRSNPFAWAAVRQALRADVVHCHQQHILVSTVAAAAARLTGRRIFCTDLGGGGWDLSSYISTDRLFQGHLHISEYSRRVFGQEGSTNARVIYGGVDTTKFSPPVDPAPHPFRCVFVGRLLPHKGVDVLIEALPDDMDAQIIGPAPDARYRDELERLASGKRVRFRYDCNDEDLVAAYRSASVVVLPERHHRSVWRLLECAGTARPDPARGHGLRRGDHFQRRRQSAGSRRSPADRARRAGKRSRTVASGIGVGPR